MISGAELRARRNAVGLEQRALAELARVTSPRLCAFEHGSYNFSAATRAPGGGVGAVRARSR